MDQKALDKRYGEDGKRTNICFTCNKTGHWARNCPDKEKQTDTSVLVYVDPYSHELKFSNNKTCISISEHEIRWCSEIILQRI